METVIEFIVANSFLIGIAASLTLSIIIAVKAEGWLEKLEAKHPEQYGEYMDNNNVTLWSILKKNK